MKNEEAADRDIEWAKREAKAHGIKVTDDQLEDYAERVAIMMSMGGMDEPDARDAAFEQIFG